VGTSYQTVVVIGEVARVRDVLGAAGVDGLVMPAGVGRTAVMPREGRLDYVDPARIAELVSGRAGFAALSNEVVDSDVVMMRAFRDGRLTHEYVSDQAMLVDWFIDDHDMTKYRLDGIEYSADVPFPQGPRGADPSALAPFGVEPIDLERLGAALRGEFDGRRPVFAEFQHRLILKAMNLDPGGLTTGYRWARGDDLPGAVPIQVKAPGSNGQTITVAISAGLPLDADPLETAQIIADAVLGGPSPMRADVGYAAVIPGAAASIEILMASQRRKPAPRSATYYVALHAAADAGDQATLVAIAERAWSAALQARYRLPEDQRPVVVVIAAEQFDIGFTSAPERRSTRATS
jgi:hypothetical protein